MKSARMILMFAGISGLGMLIAGGGSFLLVNRRYESDQMSFWGTALGNLTSEVTVAEEPYEVWFTSLHQTTRSPTDVVVLVDRLSHANVGEIGHSMSIDRFLNIHFVEILSINEISVRSWDLNQESTGGRFDGIMSGIMVLDQRFKRSDNVPVQVRDDNGTELEVTYRNDWGEFRVSRISAPYRIFKEYTSFVKAQSK